MRGVLGRVGTGFAAVCLAFVSCASLPASAAQPAHPAPVLAQRPYMGWSSWSLESTNDPAVSPNGEAWLTEQHVLAQADVMAAKLKSHGYDYVNIDAGWLGGFDAYGRPIPDATKFPDGIRHIADHVHAEGLKLGLYLAVGLYTGAYGNGTTPIYGAPGCHTSDIVYPDLRLTNGWNMSYQMNFANPCAQAYINSVAEELAGWGVDFLKLDGVGPGSGQNGANHDNTPDVAAWSTALHRTGRQIQFVLSWSLSHTDAAVWQQNSNGWRVDTDVECYCGTLVTWDNSVKQRWDDVVQWIPDAGPGHWNNLDSLDVGNGAMDGISDVERQSYMTLWAIEAAPLFSGDDLTTMDSYGLSLLTNDEVIAVDQAGNPAKPVSQTSDQQVWFARAADGSETVALFNLGAGPAQVTANWADLGLSGTASVRDLWSHTELGDANGDFGALLPAHGSRLLRITPTDRNGPMIPVHAHGVASTPSSVTLAWDPVPGRVTGYDVFAGPTKVASTSGTSVTVSGLTAATGYRFTVEARSGGRSSGPSQAVDVTTPGPGGAVLYEAEAAGNTLGGGATVYSCDGCSGGKKVGYIGGGGYMVYNGIMAPANGVYLMQLSYVDGDSSRTAILTVDGTPMEVPLPGTNDNNWDVAQTVTIPVPLLAGANTIQVGNPNGYVSDMDAVRV